MSQGTKSQKQVDLAVEGTNSASQGLKGKHLIHKHGRGQKEVDLSLNVASCNRKCVFVKMEPELKRPTYARVWSESQESSSISQSYSLWMIKLELWDAHLGASLVR